MSKTPAIDKARTKIADSWVRHQPPNAPKLAVRVAEIWFRYVAPDAWIGAFALATDENKVYLMDVALHDLDNRRRIMEVYQEKYGNEGRQ